MKKTKEFLFFLPLAPFFLAESFVLNLFSTNLGQAQLRIPVLSLVSAGILSIFIYLISLIILGNKFKTLVFSSLFIIVFFSYGEILLRLKLGSNNLLAIFFTLFLFFLFFLLKRTKKDLSKLSKLLFVIGIILPVMPIINIYQFEQKYKALKNLTSPLVFPEIKTQDVKKPLRDIYYLVPDSYSNPNTFKTVFKTDLSEFTNFLKKKGFYLPEKSTSNYPKTFSSLSSTLNMEYLDYLSRYKNSSNQALVKPLIDNNNVLKLLRQLGYKYYQMGSWWEITQNNPYADANFILENKNLLFLDEFSYAVLKSTMLEPFISRYLPKIVLGTSAEDKRIRINYQFEKLSEIVSLPGPKFVFFHLIAPHGPYVFDENCQPVNNGEGGEPNEEENYIKQTKCINKKLEEAITVILEKSTVTPIILLQTDEGAPFLGARVTPKDNWQEADTALLKEKFPILSAYYLPEAPQKALYPEISAVNAFRFIFDLYYGTDFGFLPDKNYIFQNIKDIYNFKDVTSQVIQ